MLDVDPFRGRLFVWIEEVREVGEVGVRGCWTAVIVMLNSIPDQVLVCLSCLTCLRWKGSVLRHFNITILFLE